MTDLELAEEIEKRVAEGLLVERLRKAQWDETAHRGEFNKAIQVGAPIHILEMVEGVARLCGEAATALSLSQTEIKGHMRVEEELRAELLVVQPKAQVMHDLHDALGVKWGCDPYAEIRRLKRFEKFCEELLAQNTDAQARIAILEEELRRLKNAPA